MGYPHKIVFNRVTKEQIELTKKGLEKYTYIMAGNDNVQGIRDIFADFYFVPKQSRNKILDENRFFELMGNRPSDVKEFTKKLLQEGVSNEYLISFSSKAVHTYYSNTPIYDSHVIDYLRQIAKVVMPRTNCFDRYDAIAKWYTNFLGTSESKEWINWFDKTFREYDNISDVKKIDTILYSLSVSSSKGLETLLNDLKINYKNDKELSRFCLKISDLIYSNLLTDQEALQIINYYGIDVKSGSNNKRRQKNKNGIDEIHKKLREFIAVATTNNK